jgi:hypothetical protein
MNSKFKMLIILFPFLYLLHDIEEIITVEKFLIANSNIIPFRVTTEEFALAFTLIWILASIGCLKAYAERTVFQNKAYHLPVVFSSWYFISERDWSFISIHFFQSLCARDNYNYIYHIPLFLFDSKVSYR